MMGAISVIGQNSPDQLAPPDSMGCGSFGALPNNHAHSTHSAFSGGAKLYHLLRLDRQCELDHSIHTVLARYAANHFGGMVDRNRQNELRLWHRHIRMELECRAIKSPRHVLFGLLDWAIFNAHAI